MLNILLVCNAGMSTGIMRAKIEQEAKKANVEMNVKAISMDDLRNNLEGTSLVMLGPQIRYAEKQIREIVNDKAPVMVIDSTDFGMMRGDLVYEKLMKIIE